MTSLGFVLRLASREARAARKRLLLLTASVTAGVGALVAVNSFTDNLTVSVAEQAQALLGADLAFTGRKPLAEIPRAARWIDSLARMPGTKVARSVSLAAMAYLPGSGGARLVQLRTVDPGWPFYGAVETSPAGSWPLKSSLPMTEASIRKGSPSALVTTPLSSQVMAMSPRYLP